MKGLSAAREGVCHASFTLSKPNSGMLRGRRVAFPPSFEEAALSARASAKLVARPVACLKGRVRAPGDKSVSHRALMFGALALEKTKKTEEGEEVADIESDDEALEDTDDLADETDDIEVEVEDDKGEGDR